MLKCAGISKITLGKHKYVQNKSRYDFFFFLKIHTEQHLDNNIPFWALGLAMKKTHSEFCSNKIVLY